ncbi:spondin-1-like isoform X2 [Maniola hyperantus]|uniref:spondin-1-like isoform X2 n=1 Tax=Aphantopus hyperantus TaxID=2795564 RepID=UPI001568C6BF|nr:spondin-1-like isoform X2 [Maniola hyperantus]
MITIKPSKTSKSTLYRKMRIHKSWVVIVLVVCVENGTFGFRCDRRPYASTTQSQASDGRFKLVVDGSEGTYIPEQLYIVKIIETDDESRFTGFMISAEGDIKPDPKNPRRVISLYPGELRPLNPLTAKFSDRCLYSVEHTMSSPKSSVEVYWQAPQSGNGCITLRAMVVENEDVWFEDGAPLTQILCEDMRQPDDVTPQLNYECQICDEAKYELTFTGIWSRNTHPRLYPENDWLPRYSDLVGASHAADFILWTPGSLVTEGFRDFAEHANGSKLEGEIREKIGDGIRTLIKGKGHGYPKMSSPTYAFFRTDQTNHLFTVAIAIHPSPDWFLGVTRFELCQEDSTWLKERELNLYPWDAGTDSGVSYESPNFETFPQDAVSRVQMSTYDKNSPFYEMDMKDLHPFGRLHIKLIRTYHRECKEEEPETTEEPGPSTEETTTEGGEEPSEPEEPSSEAPIVTDPESSEDCPMSQWQEWSPCDGKCENGRLHGYKWRERYHLVDGIAVEKYDPDADPSTRKEVPRFCKNHYDDFERDECEDDCSEPEEKDDLTSERRMMPVAPGHAWNSKRHIVSKRRYL